MKTVLLPAFRKDLDKIGNKKLSKFSLIQDDTKLYGLVFFMFFVVFIVTYSYTMIETSKVPYVLGVGTEKIVHIVSEKFLSVALDSSIIQRRWKNFDMNSSILLEMVSALSPAYFRLGGTASDCLIFNANATTEKSASFPFDGGFCVFDGIDCESFHRNFTMSKTDWLEINKFTKLAGVDLLFDLNVLLRNGKNWDPTNAIDLIRFSHENGLNLSWQLGNEPNSFQHVFKRTVSGKQLAKDFSVLRNILDKIYKTHVVLVGPDITRPRPPGYNSITYLEDFIEETKTKANGIVDAITWHHYYLNGRESTLEDFINPSNFQIFPKQMQLVINTVLKTSPKLPIWLTETSDAYGGGAPNLTNRFVGGFMWLDKLGLAAAHGLQIVTRQSIFGGYYSLIDEDLKPLPDFWVSVLHKKLVGNKVLKAQLGNEVKNDRNDMIPNRETLRFYCHCTPPWIFHQKGSAITIFGLNIGEETQHIKVKDVKNAQYRDAYILTGENGLQSRYSLLNDDRLELDEDGRLPAFHPVEEDPTSPIAIPPYSMGFWVYHGIKSSICD